MKIRTGFVSNSSSSSFCIFGIYLDREDMYKKWLELGLTEEEWEDSGNWDTFDILAEKLNVTFEQPISDYDEGVYLGISPDDIPEDSTIRQAREEIAKKLGVEPEDIGFYHDGGYDG